MSKKPPITETLHAILRDAPGPLTIDAAAAQLEARLPPGSSKNYKNSVRNSLANNHLGPMVKLADGRIGLTYRLFKGASVRCLLSDENLEERRLPLDSDLADLLEPNGLPNSGKALRLELGGGPKILARFEGSRAYAALDAGPALWDWLEARGAAPGDSLIVTAVDPEERRYAIVHEPAAARDDTAVALRNAEVLEAAKAILRRGRGRVPVWEITTALNASGLLHKPIPPAPFAAIWTEAVWGPVQDEYDVNFPLTGNNYNPFASLNRFLGSQEAAPPTPTVPVTINLEASDLPPGVAPEEFRDVFEGVYTQDGIHPISADHPLAQALVAVAARHSLPSPLGGLYQASQLQALFGSDPDTLDWIDEGIALGLVNEDAGYDPLLGEGFGEDPTDLPAAYARTGDERKPRPSAKGSKGPVKTYVLRLGVDYDKGFSRDIEIAEDQSFEDLHLIIQQTLGWDDDHLYSFFMSRRPHDPANEIGSPWSDTPRRTHRVTIGDADLKPKQKFLYLFDYGDEHLFNLHVLKINPAAPKGTYPKVVAQQGRAPSQYFDEDEDWDEEED